MILVRSLAWIAAAAVCAMLLMPSADADTVTYDLGLSLGASQLQSDRWSPSSLMIPGTTLNEGDTLRLNIDFGDNSLRWTDTGATEYLVFGLWTTSSSADINIRSDVSISLMNPTGAFNVADFADRANGNDIAISGNTWAFGTEDITGGAFDFTGISIEFANLVGRGLPGSSGLPEEFNRLTLSAVGGSFSILGDTFVVPIPAAGLLFPSGLLAGLALRRRRRDSAQA